MDYLRTLGSAAVSTLVQKSGLNLPFSLGSKVANFNGTCNLYEATKRDDSTPVSVFEYDLSDPTRKHLAKNALRKLRTIRHPDVLKFMDATESDSLIYIMTERVRPLESTLQAWASRKSQEREDWLIWGIHRISVALAFINDSCLSTHGNIRTNSVFISPSGEWKLGGFELLSNPKDDSQVLYTFGHTFHDASLWSSPEVKKSGWSVLKEGDVAAADAYALGLLLHAVFNPSHPMPATAQPPHTPPTPSSRGEIPQSVFPLFKKLLNPNPKGRLSPKGFLEVGMADTGFFSNNKLVKVCLGLDNFALASEGDRATLLRTLKESASSFPSEFASFKVLPSLTSALEFGGASAATILPLILQIGANTNPENYTEVIVGPVIKLFASTDRSTRMTLLEHLPEYIEKLDQKTVSDKIFPHLQTGFSDTVAVIREATIKSIILFAPKLNGRLLNNDLLRHLAKLQMDPEASIRTNTCILIGRLGPSLGYHTKRKVLVPAFLRALKDPFLHTRVAGLMALMATIDCFEIEELATKVIPNMSFTLMDKEKLVRDQAFKALELFVKKLEAHVATMPETAPESITLEISAATLSEPTTLVNSAAGAAGALAGWAISSLGKKLASTDLQSNMVALPDVSLDRSLSAPPSNGGTLAPGQTGWPLSSGTSASASNSTSQLSTSQSKGMHLGKSLGSRSGMDDLVDQLTAEAMTENSASNPWGSDDLIDINADQDDWSAFESAPAIIEPKPLPAVGLGLQNLSSKSSMRLSPQPKTKPMISHAYSAPSTPRTAVGKVAASPVVSSTSTMTKEEKAAEMARRKEERKQRIALLKEQKNQSSTT